MTLWQKLMAAKDALDYGEKLNNSEVWKNAAMVINLIAGLLTAVLPFVPEFENVEPEIIDHIASGVYGVVFLFNLYVHPATTTTVHLPIIGKSNPTVKRHK